MGVKEQIKDTLWSFKKNRTTQVVLLVVLVLAIAVLVGFLFLKSDNPSVVFDEYTDARQTDSTSTKVSRVIDGVRVDERENLYPALVMIENLSTIRGRQYGLSEANLVIEALAEGGITRFLAIFAEGEDLERLGPVRSGRGYFLKWMEGFGGLYAHAGGSPEALSLIHDLEHIVDVNQIGGDHAYFWRDPEFSAPHNLFTSTEFLTRAGRDKGAPTEGDFESWTYKNDTPIEERPEESKTIRIDYSTFSYLVEYEYDRIENSYLRKNGGEVQIDALNGSEIRPKNVVVQYVRTSLLDTQNRLDMEVVGEGAALVFRDGAIISATWKKGAIDERTMFVDEDGEPIEFNRGTTWIEVVPTDRTVEYN